MSDSTPSSISGLPSASPRTLSQKRLNREKALRSAQTAPRLVSPSVPRSGGITAEERRIAKLGIRESQAYAGKMTSQIFDLRLKFHHEQIKSERLERKLEALGKAYEDRDKDIQDLCQQIRMLKERNEMIHASLEKQDDVVSEARLINESYQKRFEELQARFEQYQEENKTQLHTESRDRSPDLEYSDDTPTAANSYRRGNRNFLLGAAAPVTTTRRVKIRALPRSPPRTESEDEISDLDSSNFSAPLSSPALPSEEASLYGPNGHDDSDITDPSPKETTPQFPLRMIEELNARTEEHKRFFERAKFRLEEFSKTFEQKSIEPEGERALQDVRLALDGSILYEDASSILPSENDPEVLRRPTAHSELSFEIVHMPAHTGPMSIRGVNEESTTDSWLPPSAASELFAATTVPVRQQKTAPSPPLSPEDVWLSEALSGRPKLRRRVRKSSYGMLVRHDLPSPTPEAFMTRLNQVVQEQIQAQSCCEESAVEPHLSPNNGAPPADSTAVHQSPPTTPKRSASLSAKIAASVARSAKRFGFGGYRKPKVVMPAMSSSPTLTKRSGGERRFQPSHHLLSGRSSWESLRDDEDAAKDGSRGFLKPTISAKNKEKKRGWGPSAGRR